MSRLSDLFMTCQNLSLNESECLGFDSQKKFALENSARRVEWDVEPWNACVSCRKLVIMSRFHCDGWFWLETFFACRQGRARCPKIDLEAKYRQLQRVNMWKLIKNKDKTLSWKLKNENHRTTSNTSNYLQKIFVHRFQLSYRCWYILVMQRFRVVYLTIILRNRAEYRLILSRRGRRPSWLKSDDIPQDWAG